MQRLLQSLPSSALRMARVSSVHARPTLSSTIPRLASLPLTTRFSSTSTQDKASDTPEDNAKKALAAAESRWLEMSDDALDPINPPPNDSYAGRSVTNSAAKNLATTFKKLDSILGRNRLRQELRLAERHEKKGEKRRRLQSQRWKNRFANEVRQKVQLVNKIRMRGA